MSQPRPDLPLLVQTNKEFDRMASRLKRESRLAIDIESNSLYAYQERVCLIQFSIPGRDYILDPLALPEIEALGPILADPDKVQVFHAAEYDLMSLKRDFDFRVGALFDTQVATRMLGRKKTGLASVLQEEFGVRQNKRFQRANWGARPLSQDMLDYARLDTHYLLPLHDRLEEALEAAGLTEPATELFKWQTQNLNLNHRFDPDGFWRIGPARKLSPRRLAILRELYLYRDEQARSKDRPPFKVFTDETLLAIVDGLPRSDRELGQLPGMTDRQVRSYGKGIRAAIARGKAAEPPRRPKRRRMDEAVYERYELLRDWRKHRARDLGVESDIVLPRDVVQKIAQNTPTTRKALKKIMGPLEWRFRTYSAEILKILEESPA